MTAKQCSQRSGLPGQRKPGEGPPVGWSGQARVSAARQGGDGPAEGARRQRPAAAGSGGQVGVGPRHSAPGRMARTGYCYYCVPLRHTGERLAEGCACCEGAAEGSGDAYCLPDDCGDDP